LTLFTVKGLLNDLLKDYGYGGLQSSFANVYVVPMGEKTEDIKIRVYSLLTEEEELPKKYIVVMGDQLRPKTWQYFLKIIEDHEEVSTIIISSHGGAIPATIKSRTFSWTDAPSQKDVARYFNQELSLEHYLTIVRYSLYSKEKVETLLELDDILDDGNIQGLYQKTDNISAVYYLLLRGIAAKLTGHKAGFFTEREFDRAQNLIRNLNRRNLRMVRVLLFAMLRQDKA
jgi:hypothetical protein